MRRETVYGMTSLPPERAEAAALRELNRLSGFCKNAAKLPLAYFSGLLYIVAARCNVFVKRYTSVLLLNR